jgi:hypothetical protein
MSTGKTLFLQVELEAIVDDEPLWEEIRAKLIEGIRIYKGEDFHNALVEAVKADLNDTLTEKAQLERELRKEKAARVLAEEELEKHRTALARWFGSALRGG